MPSSSTQAACSSSCFLSDIEKAYDWYVKRLVQLALRTVVDAAGHSTRYLARLIGQVLSSADNTTPAILRKLVFGQIQNEEEIAVPSPQAAAVFSNPNYRDSHVQLLDEIARGNRYSDVYSLALKISRKRPIIRNWEMGDHLIGKGSYSSVSTGYSKEHKLFFAAKGASLREHKHLCHLKNEISILKRLDHENIVQYYGTLKDEEMLYIFLELVSHGTLQQAYKNFCFDESQVSHYTRQILQGLRYLHSCKVVHGDLKCANILVTELGRIKLADFGLSKSMEDSQSLKLGSGSLFWMAPEVAKHKRDGYGFASDIWSLGCTVTEMLTRKYPQYNARDVWDIGNAINNGKGPVVPAYLSDTLKDFINQCLQPDPKQRPTADYLLAHPFVKE